MRPLTTKNRDFDGIRRKEGDLWFYSVTVDHRAGALRLMGILSGLVVLFEMFSAKRLNAWTWFFMVTTLLTSVSGFFFPFHLLLLSHILGVLLVISMVIVVYTWRSGYVMSAAIALHLNVFVWIAQLFPKVPSLKALAPTQSEPPFQGTQLIVMVIFITLSVFAVEGFRPDLARAT